MAIHKRFFHFCFFFPTTPAPSAADTQNNTVQIQKIGLLYKSGEMLPKKKQ